MAIQAGSDEGLTGRWFAAAFGIAGITGVILFPFFRVWLRKAALPSVRLPQAVRASGPRRLEASPRDWRRWALFTGVVLLVGGAAMLIFLIGVLGRGGTAEGVVVGALAAWGAATLEDARRILAIEEAEGRRYYAACRRPTGVGGKLVWIPRRAAGGPTVGLSYSFGSCRRRSRKRRSGRSAKSSVYPHLMQVSERTELTLPEAIAERRRLSETMPESTVCSMGPPH